MKTNKLTRKQEEILIFIKKYIAKNEYPPTVREIAKAVNLSSPATVHVHLQNLIEKGYIKRNKRNHRILELLVPNEFLQVSNGDIDILLLRNNKKNSSFKVLRDHISNYNEVIAFEVDNDNLKNLGINLGDILIFEVTNKINNNDIILVKDSNNYKVIENNMNANSDDITYKLVRLYREY